MYALQADLEKRLSPATLAELADDDGDGLADAEVVEAALADAAARIDTHLAARYATPVDPPPPALAEAACALAAQALFARRRAAAPPEHAARHAEALRMLEALGGGLRRLPGAIPRDLPAASRRGADKVFSARSLDDF